MKAKRLLSLLMALVMVFAIVAPVAANTTKYDVNIHKVKMSTIPTETFPGTTGVDGTEYTGAKIADPEAYFANGYEALSGVVFTYWKVSEEQYNTMMETPENYDTVDKVKTAYSALGDGTNTAATGADGVVGVTDLEEGHYWFVENIALSQLPDGQTFSTAVAVPFGLALPVYKADGTTFTTGDNALHVYPKNTTTDKPDVVKDFKEEEVRTQDQIAADVRNYSVGDNVPYKITTTIPAGAEYGTARWSDRMTEGLTFNNDITVTINGDTTTNYTLDWTVNGFDLDFTQDGLDQINGQNDPVTVVIEYSAELNSAAVVEVPEANDVTFHYGNNPTNGNTPIPTKPVNNQITVTKTWAEGTAPAGVTAEFILYNAQTGVEVARITLGTETNPGWSYTFEGLDADTEYKVVETWNGYTPEYLAENGTIGVKNHKDNNPEPIKPVEPRVVTYEKLFVKTDGKGERLEGAQFVVKNADGKFLAYKTTVQEGQDAQALADAKTAYDNAVAAYNARTEESDEVALMAEVTRTQQEYFAAFQTAKTGYSWVANQADAHVFTSNEAGQIRVYGLAEGSYQLVEIQAPIGFAKLTGPVNFTIGTGEVKDIDYVADSNATDAQEVINKKITIPQTGGIGTLIFVVLGLTLMGGAVIAMKRTKREEA